MSYWYIASPYSHPDPLVRLHRYEEAIRFTKFLLFKQKLYCFSPIVHTHPIDESDYSVWGGWNRAMIGRSEGIIVLMIPGWNESVGVVAEMEFCKEINLPVFMSATRWLDYDHTL